MLRSTDLPSLPARAPLFALLFLLVGCASGPFAGRVTIVDFSQGEPTRLSLASRTHMTEVMGVDPVEWFSSKRDSVELKMTEDDDMRGLVSELRKLGFDDLATAGPGAAASGVGLANVIEVQTKDGVRHVSTMAGGDAQRIAGASKMKWAFIQLYNATISLQSVSEEFGQVLFEETSRKIGNR